MSLISLSTMWAKGRFGNMTEFVTKAKGLGFTHVEVNASVSPLALIELIKTSVPISSIHSPCPAVLSSKGIPVANLSLSSTEKSERRETVNFTKKTIDLASTIGAKAVIIHAGEVPINLGLEDKLRQLYKQHLAQTKEYSRVKEQLVYQRVSKVSPFLEAARESLAELSRYSQGKGITLGLETRFYFHEIPNIDEMEELLKETKGRWVGYWHDVGHAEVQQRLGFASHEEWLSRFKNRMIGVHLHDVLGISDHRPPGKGDVNWDMVAKHLPHTPRQIKGADGWAILDRVIRVCEIAEWHGESQIQGVVDFLREKGVI